MIAYFDTSAIVPLVIDEPGSAAALDAWNEASRVASIPLLYAEARAALAQAQRERRLTAGQLGGAVRALDERYAQLDLVKIDDDLCHGAGELAEAQALRGYDAVHLAAAREIDDADLVVVAGDHQLLRAARSIGFAVIDVS